MIASHAGKEFVFDAAILLPCSLKLVAEFVKASEFTRKVFRIAKSSSVGIDNPACFAGGSTPAHTLQKQKRNKPLRARCAFSRIVSTF